MSIDKKIAVTNYLIPILNNIISSPIFTSPTDKLLLKMESDTRIFVSAHPNIIFTHADKGNVTVALDKDAYLNKMITLLSDVDTYVLINKDPIKKLMKSIKVKTHLHFKAAISRDSTDLENLIVRICR
ncbi:hypothetical protein ALC56_09920 [Trachymyrmex septentrionalis]|uniref:Uncharacterized protein n=1 Tax=Trachymyrmex septentrionalis TaxID=34720 RepID=A0A195F557_9HYME|nr:hypothetical protein ALC56_09920 [Trachymyrmex septentrionalis]